MSTDNNDNNPTSPTYDSQMNAVFSPQTADNSHLIGITSQVVNTEPVRSTDYDEAVARTAQPPPQSHPTPQRSSPRSTFRQRGRPQASALATRRY
jgi:hypothetical protein